MQRIKKGDEVIVITGKSKGHHGKVNQILRDKTKKIVKVVVEGANLIKKAVKPDPQRNVKKGFVDKEMPIHISNVAIYNAAKESRDKVKIKQLEDGKKVRCFKSDNEMIDS
jgi:large subunit ribosomal protein L24